MDDLSFIVGELYLVSSYPIYWGIKKHYAWYDMNNKLYNNTPKEAIGIYIESEFFLLNPENLRLHTFLFPQGIFGVTERGHRIRKLGGDMSRVSVEVGSVVDVRFIKPVARIVSLAGMQEKYELDLSFFGTIIAIIDSGKKLDNGKPDFEFTIEDSSGSKLKTRRSNIFDCICIVSS